MPQEPQQSSWKTNLAIGLSSAGLFGVLVGGAIIWGAYVVRGGSPTPAPTDASLKGLLESDKQAIASQYFADYASVAKTGEIETVQEAYNVYKRSVGILKNAKNWVGVNPEFDKAVSEILESKLGKSGPVDKDVLAATFTEISEGLK